MDKTENQNFLFGILAGVVAAVIGAVIWAVITVTTNYQIGWMAVGVGFLVGYAIKIFGKGVDPVFGISGAVIALLGCVAGNLLTVVIIGSNQEQVGVLTVLTRLTPGIVVDLLKETFQPMDLLFYGIAVYEGTSSLLRRKPRKRPPRSRGTDAGVVILFRQSRHEQGRNVPAARSGGTGGSISGRRPAAVSQRQALRHPGIACPCRNASPEISETSS